MSNSPAIDNDPPRLTVHERLQAMRAASAVALREKLKESNAIGSPQALEAVDSELVVVQATVESKFPETEIKLGEQEFIVPLKMHSHLVEQYTNVLVDSTDEINDFLQTTIPLPIKTEAMENLVDSLNCILKAPDLVNIEEGEDEEVPSKAKAAWAVSCSSKFSFLKALLNNLRDLPMHICLAVAPGRFTDLTASFLDGLDFTYKRSDGIAEPIKEHPSGTGRLFISLLPTGVEGQTIVPPSSANVVIAMDDSFNPDERQLRRTRSHALDVDKRCPVLHLIISNSPEHVALCIPKNTTKTRRLQALVGLSWRLMGHLGASATFFVSEIEDSYPEYVAHFIRGEGMGTWPLPYLAPVSQLQDFLGPDMPTIGSPPTSESEGSEKAITLKRQRDSDTDEEPSTKRQRSTPAQDARTSTTNPSKYHSPPPLAYPDSIPPEGVNQMSVKVNEFKQMRETIRDYSEAISTLQARFEKLSVDYAKAAKVNDTMIATKAGSIQQIASVRNNLQKYKEENQRLQAELASARGAAIASTIPGVSELAAAREDARINASAREKFEKMHQNLKRDFDYTQTQYQAASIAAAEAANQVRSLEEENARLAKKGEANAVQLRELVMVQQTDDDGMRIRELEANLAECEDVIRRKDEEIKGLKSRGLATRGTSVPRSPKMYHSRPTSPAPGIFRTSTIANRTAGQGSIGHPLRNS
ncbi:MAG: hypothetical protein M1814_001670 [Vezdaea aestivalis]|nr:MAG: hypothetical protein M1814_001670 [Vezdaea aestivalis]